MYYPDQRIVSGMTVIRRRVMLPDEAAGVVRVNEGKRVDVRDVIANGAVATGYVMVDAMEALGLKKPESLHDLMLVERNDVVEEDQVLAGKNPRRGRRVFSPIRGIVAQVIDGRILLQKIPRLIDLEAGVRGQVSRIDQARGVEIESVGGQVQGVWGNDKSLISTLRLEPEGGLSYVTSDVLEMRYTGAVVVTRSPLTEQGFRVIDEQSLSGVIAPSMDASLVSKAMAHEAAIVLTEGFGDSRMNTTTYNLLVEFEGNNITLDAHTPTRWELRYPDIIVNRRPNEGQRPSRPNVMLNLRKDMTVRVSRDPYTGQTGRVDEIPNQPQLLENGLRVLCARVELVTGETISVPLENLEVLSR